MKKILSALLVFVSIVLFFVFDFHFFGRLSQHSWVDYLGIVFAYCLFAMGIRFLFMSKFSWKYSACIMGSFALCLVIVLSLFRLQMPERGFGAVFLEVGMDQAAFVVGHGLQGLGAARHFGFFHGGFGRFF